MTIAPAAYGLRLDLTPAQLRRNLAGAPVGQHGLVEAALAWQRSRALGPLPGGSSVRLPGGPAVAGQPAYLPILATAEEEVAVRVARLLSGLTFCVVGQPDPGIPRWQVEVPETRNRPVIRALSLVWRDTLRQFGPGARVGGAGRGPAVAVWRMASLIADGGPNPHVITVGAGTPAVADLLIAASARLGVRASVRRVRRLPAVVVDEPDQVRLLLLTLLRTPL
jgi:hypothetical protein